MNSLFKWRFPWRYHSSGSKTQEQMKDKDGNPIGTQLTITNADSSDAGDYICTSANTHGEISRSVRVTVTKSSSKRSTLQEFSKWLTVLSWCTYRAIFNWLSKVIAELLRFCFTIATLYDWLRKLAPSTQPIRCKTKTNCDLVARVFPRFLPVACICFEFSLVRCVVFVCCDWSL